MLSRFLSLPALLVLPLATQAQLWNKTIETTYGPVQGFEYFNRSTLETYFNTSTSNVTAFLGVPYAADTGYENRWKPPQPRARWNETLHATDFGNICPTGDAGFGNGTPTPGNVSEDCLTLNIWTSAADAGAKLPVMVWNQGSGETSNNSWWHGGGMAMKDVILISFNRRDYAFGFLAHPELNQEGYERTGHETSGNYGILDHLEVLKWVRDNIARFGGDPSRVTVAGQSFGSSQVYHAVNSALFTGLFHGGISQSGIRYPYDTLLAGLATSYVTMDEALAHGVNYTTTHNASSIAELRTLSMDDLLVGSGDRVGNDTIWWVTALSAGYPLVYKPVLDGYVLPTTYLETLRQGPANDVPVITGNTKDESGASLSTDYTFGEYERYCRLKYGDLADRYLALYPAQHNQTRADRAWNAAARDTSLVGSWAYATEWYRAASSPFYTYYWTHAPPGQDQGAFHQSEIMYALDALYANGQTYPFTDEDTAIAATMSAYWANFAKTLDPNQGRSYTGRAEGGGGDRGDGVLPRWVPNNPNGSQVVMELGQRFANVPIASPDQVDFLMDYFHQQTPY